MVTEKFYSTSERKLDSNYKEIVIKMKVRNENETENIIRLLLLNGGALDLICLCWKKSWSDFTCLLTSDLSWTGARQNGKLRPLQILNCVHSGANQNWNSTGLAPSMTSSHSTTHLTLESLVFIGLIYTWRQMTLFFGRWGYCFGRWRYCPYKVDHGNIGGCSFQVVVDNSWTYSSSGNCKQNGKDKIL